MSIAGEEGGRGRGGGGGGGRVLWTRGGRERGVCVGRVGFRIVCR